MAFTIQHCPFLQSDTLSELEVKLQVGVMVPQHKHTHYQHHWCIHSYYFSYATSPRARPHQVSQKPARVNVITNKRASNQRERVRFDRAGGNIPLYKARTRKTAPLEVPAPGEQSNPRGSQLHPRPREHHGPPEHPAEALGFIDSTMSMEPRPGCSHYDINYLNMRAGTEREEQPGQCLDWHRCFGKTPKEELSLAGAGGLDVTQVADADTLAIAVPQTPPAHAPWASITWCFFCFPPSTDVKTTATLVVETVGNEPPTEPKHGAAAVNHVGARALIRVNEENCEGVRHGGGGGGGGSLDGGDSQDGGGGGGSLDGSDSHDGSGGGGLDGSDSRSGSDSLGRDGEGNDSGGGNCDLEALQQQEEPPPAVAQGLQIPVREDRPGRFVFTKWQLQALEDTFRRAPYPSLLAP